MIDFLFSMLLVPLLPELGDPHINHAEAISTLQKRLSEKPPITPVEVVAQPSNMLISSGESLPAISGRLFEWSNAALKEDSDPLEAVDLSAESLRLTGLIESAGQKVAILNDGEDDYVVGLGSYVLGVYKVASFGPGRVVLRRVDGRSGEKRIELNLMQDESVGELQ